MTSCARDPTGWAARGYNHLVWKFVAHIVLLACLAIAAAWYSQQRPTIDAVPWHTGDREARRSQEDNRRSGVQETRKRSTRDQETKRSYLSKRIAPPVDRYF